MDIRYIGADEIHTRLDMDTCIGLMRQVFTSFAAGHIKNILRSVAPMERGILGIMPAVLPDRAVAGAKLITVMPDNPARGLPGHQGIVAVFDAGSGTPLGVCDGGAITSIRTAAVSALATDMLANPAADTLCILGSGVQAEMHLKAIHCIRPLRRVKVWSRDERHAARFVQTQQAKYPGIAMAICETAREAAEGADILCTVTTSSTPVLQGAWLKPGAHINAVGACAAGDRELDSDCMRRAKLVCDSETACRAESGDFLIPLAEGLIGEGHILATLGEVVAGVRPIRTGAADITCFESLGLAEEDLACAAYLLAQK